MAKLWYDGSKIVRFCKTEEEAAQFGEPKQFTGTIAFDETTNAAAIDGLSKDWNSYSIVSGVLMYKGQPVLIVADSDDAAERKEILAKAEQLLTDLSDGKATMDDVQAAIAFLLKRELGRLTGKFSGKGD